MNRRIRATKAVTKTQSAVLAAIVIVIIIAGIAAYFLWISTPTTEETIKIGAIYPLTGAGAVSGKEAKDAVLLAEEIVNGKFDFPLPLAKTEGLPNLGGRKIQIIVGNAASDAKVSAAEAERLITMENVVALIGAYWSSLAETASAVAERYGVPFLSAACTAPDLTERGFKWFFRTTPTEEHNSEQYLKFLDWVTNEKGIEVKTICVESENTYFGVQYADWIIKRAQEHGYEAIGPVLHTPASTDLTAEVTNVKSIDADVLFTSGVVPDAILFTNTLKKFDVNPKAIIYSEVPTDPAYITALGNDANYIFCRGLFSMALAETKPWVATIEKMFRDRSGVTFGDTSARTFTGLLVLCDAINRAGSTDPEAIREALMETEMSTDEMIMPWDGIRFDEKGQNEIAFAMVLQILDQKLEIVYPRELATADPVFPSPTWAEKS